MIDSNTVSAISHSIQLSVAPVFLITGLSALLSVMTNRLGRIIDRARKLEQSTMKDEASDDLARGQHHESLRMLSRRAKWINIAIILCTISMLSVVAAITSMFITVFIDYPAAVVVATIFVLALTSLVLSLLFFLREIVVASHNLRIGSGHT